MSMYRVMPRGTRRTGLGRGKRPPIRETAVVIVSAANSVVSLQGEAKRHKAYRAWAKKMAAKPRPKDPLKLLKRRKAAEDAEQDLALQIR